MGEPLAEQSIRNELGPKGGFIGKSVDQLQIENKKLSKKNIRDALTGLFNRGYLDRFLKKSLGQHQPMSIILLDIDNFKQTNDTLGHTAGDAILRELSALLVRNLRTARPLTKDEDKVARYGGEEIAIVLPNTTKEIAAKISERLRTDIEKNEFFINYEGKEVPIYKTVSMGVTESKVDDSPKSLIDRVDSALYEAKHKGKNKVEIN